MLMWMQNGFSFSQIVQMIAIMIIPFTISLSMHEAMHAYAAHRLGDDTAKSAGRLTLNPFNHIDILGLITLLITGVIGWAKPVPVNYYNIQHKYGIAIVSAAGPLSNLLLAFIFAFLWTLLVMFGSGMPEFILTPLTMMITYAMLINIILFIFNLLPIMPMDGARIIANFMPAPLAEKYEATGRYYFIIFLILWISGLLHKIMYPLKDGMLRLLDEFVNVVALILS